MHYVKAFFLNFCLELTYFSQNSVAEVKILLNLMQNIPDLALELRKPCSTAKYFDEIFLNFFAISGRLILSQLFF